MSLLNIFVKKLSFFFIFKKKETRKINELLIFEEFRLGLKDDEKERVESLRKDFKEKPISSTFLLLLLAIGTPFASEGRKFYSQTPGDIVSAFKSSIRDSAINQVSHNLRKLNKRAFDCKKEELETLILKEEARIKKKGSLRILKMVLMAHLGFGVLPNS